MRRLILTGLLIIAASARADEVTPPSPLPPQPHVVSEKDLVSDDGYVVKLSLPTEDDLKAWSNPGFRIGLGVGYGHFWATGPAQALRLTSFTLRVLDRLDRFWSIGLDLQYAVAGGAPLSGLRFGATGQALAHPWRQLTLALGMGYGGFVLNQTSGTPIVPGNGSEVANVTFGNSARLGACSGGGWVGLARVEYLFVVGPLFATGPYVEAETQYTQCQQTLSGNNPSTGNPIYAQQWWLNEGVTAGWWFTWR